MARKSLTQSRLLLVLGLVTLVLGTREPSMVRFENNGYKDLLVAISPSVDASQSEDLLNNIKRMISEASPILYKATEDMAYFAQVHILIPPSWTHINASLSTWESFDSADVIIDSPNPRHGDTPYTDQQGKCGEHGEKIHLTPNYVRTIHEESNVKQHGKPGKVFVHEWAHYRYGIFDEYGQVDDSQYPLFVPAPNTPNSPPLPNVCTDKVPTDFKVLDKNNKPCSYNRITMKYPDGCRYEFASTFKPKSSLASNHALLNSVDMFCNEKTHVKTALNKHNAECDGKSTWDIIKINKDFESVSKFDMDRTSQVSFHIVRPNGQRFVLVADVSLSMETNNRIGKLGESVRAWIGQDLPAGSKLGIIQFSSTAKNLSDITLITDQQSRDDLMKKVPSQLESATCIKCGLEMAYEMLLTDYESSDESWDDGSSDESPEKKVGGVIVLVTDGKNSAAYGEISDVIPFLKNETIRVVTIAFGKDADKDLEKLADETHGKSYFIDDQDTSADIQEAFQGALTFQPYVNSSDLVFVLFNSNTTENAARKIEGSFVVDSTIGHNLTLKVYNMNNPNQIRSMKLIGPAGKPTIEKKIFNTITDAVLAVPDIAKVGNWSLVVELNPNIKSSLFVTVTAKSKPENDEHSLKTSCWVANGGDIRDPASNPVLIQAKVLKGTNPVIGAKVRAYVTKPDSTVRHVFPLYDNGTNGDTTANDGTYSHYFTNATIQGRYTVKCQIEGTQSSYTELGFIGSRNPSNHGRSKRSTEKSTTGGFNRIVSGGSFQIGKPLSGVDDMYPPAQVTDLTVSLVNHSDSNVSIAMQWTAPGDELDSGTVSFYELVYADDANELFNLKNLKDSRLLETNGRILVTKDDLVAGSIQPLEAGSLQSATFELKKIKRKMPYYVALRSVDKAKKTSKISNVAIFIVPRNPGEDSNEIDVDDQNVFVHLLDQMNTPTAIMTGFFIALILCLCVSLLLLAIVKLAKKNVSEYKPVRVHLGPKDHV